MQSYNQKNSVPIQNDERAQLLEKVTVRIKASGKPNFPDYITNRFFSEVSNGDMLLVKKLSDKLVNEHNNQIEDIHKLFKMAFFYAIKNQHPDIAMFLARGYMPVILLQQPTANELEKVKRSEKILLVYKQDANCLDIIYCDDNGNIKKDNLFNSNNQKSLMSEWIVKFELKASIDACINNNNIISNDFSHLLIRILKINDIAAHGLLASMALQLSNTILPSPFSDKLPLSLWIEFIENTEEACKKQQTFIYLLEYGEENIRKELINRINHPDLAGNKEKLMRLHDLLRHAKINPDYHHLVHPRAGIHLAIKMNHMQLFSHLIKTSVYYPDFLNQIYYIHNDEIMNYCSAEMRLIIYICRHVTNMQHWQDILSIVQNDVTPKMLVSNYFITLCQSYTNESRHLYLISQLLKNYGIQMLHDKNDWNELLMFVDFGKPDADKHDLLQWYICQAMQPVETKKRKLVADAGDIISIKKHKSLTLFTLAEVAQDQYVDPLRTKIKEAWSVLREVLLVLNKFDYEENLVIPLDLYRYILALTFAAIQRDRMIASSENEFPMGFRP